MSKQIEENQDREIPLAKNGKQALDQSALDQPHSQESIAETQANEEGVEEKGKKKAPKSRKKRSLIGRFFTWLLSSFLMLSTAIILLLFFLVDTQAGLKTLTAAANRYVGDYISIGDATGA